MWLMHACVPRFSWYVKVSHPPVIPIWFIDFRLPWKRNCYTCGHPGTMLNDLILKWFNDWAEETPSSFVFCLTLLERFGGWYWHDLPVCQVEGWQFGLKVHDSPECRIYMCMIIYKKTQYTVHKYMKIAEWWLVGYILCCTIFQLNYIQMGLHGHNNVKLSGNL